MNTTQKGDAFEEVVFNHLKQWIDSGRSCFNKECCRIYQKKTLETKSRIAKYEFDIVIEIYDNPKNETPLIYVCFECKDHSSPISIRDIAEFGFKVQNIKGSKGIFVSKNEYQNGAVGTARENSIALVRYSGKKYADFEYLLHRIDFANQTRRGKLIQELSTQISKRTFLAEYECKSYTEPESLLCDILNITQVKSKVPYISDEKLDDVCKSLVDRFEIPVITETLTELLRNIGFDIILQQSDEENLGLCDFINHSVVLNEQLPMHPHRYRFTLAHELGHVILHQKYFVDAGVASIQDSPTEITSLNEDDISLLEIQANKFAACLLMPKKIFAETFYEIKKRLSIPYPNTAMYLDNQQCNIKDYKQVCLLLAKGFNVSEASVDIRMRNLKLVEIHDEPVRHKPYDFF